ncbi:MAG: DUF2807 domain-containing protein [Pseudomonadota bacterium]
MWRFALPLIVFTSAAQAEEKTFAFTGIDSIDARNGVTVNVVQGDEVSIIAEAVKGDVDQVIVRKFGPWLAINRSTRWFIFPYGRSDEIIVTVTLPSLRNVKAFGSASATAQGFDGESLRAEALQGGRVDVTDIDIADVTLYATENGQLTVSGNCETVVAEAIIGAAVEAGDLSCANAAVTTRSGGAVMASATELASQDDSAGGTIQINGSPSLVEYLPGMEPEVEEEAVAVDG